MDTNRNVSSCWVQTSGWSRPTALSIHCFKSEKSETEGFKSIYDLGNEAVDNPELSRLLEDILQANTHFDNFRVDFEFPNIGRRKMILNARRIGSRSNGGENDTPCN